MAADGLSLDVCTGGELAVALRAGVPAERIGLHGNNKSDAELRRALGAGVGRIVVDSLEEIDRVADLAGEAGVRAPVLLRVTVGVEAHTHEYIATAHEDQKFGLSITGGAAAEAVRRALARTRARAPRTAQPHRLADLRHRRLRGRGPPGAAACTRDDRRRARRRAAGARPRRRVRHRLHQRARPARARRPSRRSSPGSCVRECAALGVAVPRVSVEPGRAIAGPSTFTLYEVGRGQGRAARPRRAPALRRGRRRHERQHPHRPLRRRLLVHARLAGLDGAAGARPRRRASTARAATSSCATSSCPATSAAATCSPSPAPARTAGAWRALQPRAAAAGGRRPGRRGPGDRPPRDRGRPAGPGRRLTPPSATIKELLGIKESHSRFWGSRRALRLQVDFDGHPVAGRSRRSAPRRRVGGVPGVGAPGGVPTRV